MSPDSCQQEKIASPGDPVDKSIPTYTSPQLVVPIPAADNFLVPGSRGGNTGIGTSPELYHSRQPHEQQQHHQHTLSYQSTNTSPYQNDISSPNRPHGFPTDELCPRALIHLIADDYLEFIYPLIPAVHRPTFRANLSANKDVHDPEFLALLFAIVATTIGLLPSRFPYYKSAATAAYETFNTRVRAVDRCINLCMELRTINYWEQLSQRKWAVCYLLAAAAAQLGQVNRGRMLEVESMQIGRLLGLHRMADYEGLNCIETQLRKKSFWLLFYTYA